jgi:hypothetical protein
MAKPEEEQRDQLFGMNVGDGLIEVNTEEKPAATAVEDTNTEDDAAKAAAKAAKAAEAGETTQYDDGTFEIDDTPSEATEAATAKEQQEFIENTEDKSKEKGKAPSEDGSSDSSSSSPFLAFARDRANEGVFLNFTDEDWATLKERNEGDEAAALRELSVLSVQDQIRMGIESYKDSITPEERALYEARDKGLPLDEYSVAKRGFDRFSKIAKEDLAENVELQEEVVSKGLELRGFSPEEIKEEIEGYKALENLAAKAEKVLPLLPKTFKVKMDDMEAGAKADEEARQDGIRQRVARMKRTVDNTPEIIPGIKLTKPAKERIMKSMTIPVAKDEHGQPLNPVTATRAKNPDAFEMMIHYYHELGLFNIDDEGQMKPDFSKIAKVEKTKATDQMRTIFESPDKPIAGKAKVPVVQEDELDDFEKAFRRL